MLDRHLLHTLVILLVPVEASDLMLVINVMQGTIEVVSFELDP